MAPRPFLVISFGAADLLACAPPPRDAMMTSMYELIPPTSRLHASWIEARNEWSAGEFMHGSSIRTSEGLNLDDAGDFTQWVEGLLLQADASYPKDPGVVSATNLWVVENDRYLGSLQLRHFAPDAELGVAQSHIGYGVRPSARRGGVAHFALENSLPYAQRLGLKRVLVTCDDNNVASARTIESCGGVFERIQPLVHELIVMGCTRPLKRYWIEL